MQLVVGTMVINQFRELKSKARPRPCIYLHEAITLYALAPCQDSKDWALNQLRLYYQGYTNDRSF